MWSEKFNGMILPWQRGDPDLCLAVCGRWRGTEVAGRRVDERGSKGRWRNNGSGRRMKLWRQSMVCCLLDGALDVLAEECGPQCGQSGCDGLEVESVVFWVVVVVWRWWVAAVRQGQQQWWLLPRGGRLRP